MHLFRSIVVLALLLIVCSFARAAEFSQTREFVRMVSIDKPLASGKIAQLSYGSGVIIAPGYVLTAAHVVGVQQPGEQITVLARGKRPGVQVDLIRIATAVGTDLALLYSPAIQCPCASIAQTNPEVDQLIYQVGFPLNSLYSVQYLTTGTIQAIMNRGMFATTNTAPGSSGGGQFVRSEDGRYELVGIVSSIVTMGKMPSAPFLDQRVMMTWMTISAPTLKIRSFLQGIPFDSR